jgi:hypothetical protein
MNFLLIVTSPVEGQVGFGVRRTNQELLSAIATKGQ